METNFNLCDETGQWWSDKDYKEKIETNKIISSVILGYAPVKNNIPVLGEIEINENLSLGDYNRILHEAIVPMASSELNIVFHSGGWDSTLILGILRNYLGEGKVRAITMKVILPDGRCFNKFEIDKVERICKILGVESDIVEVNYQTEDFNKGMEKYKKCLFDNNIFYYAPPNWFKVADYIRDNYPNAVIFNGEGADSLHNWGFSQGTATDKIQNYLYSPEFFKNIKKESIFPYLLSLIISKDRVPFSKIEKNGYIKKVAFEKFLLWLKENYFKKAEQNINEKNIYFWYYWLYTQFHLNCPHISIDKYAFSNIIYPYLNPELAKFLYKMPESWGRDLGDNPTKYPLKELAKKELPKEVIDIIQETPRCYLNEIEDINKYDEYLLKGTLGKYVKDTIDVGNIKSIFGEDSFEIDKIKKLVIDVKSGQKKNLSTIEANILTMLMLC